MKVTKSILTSIAIALLAACGGGGSGTPDTTETPAPTPAPAAGGSPTPAPGIPTPTPTPPGAPVPTPAPGVSITPTPTSCTAAPVATGQPFSRVFKGCSASNVAIYYELTECVRQNSTGLIWQGHSPRAGAPHTHSNNVLNNYDSTTIKQKYQGAEYPTQADIDSSLNTVTYKNGVNTYGLCGFNNWRLPTIYELYSGMRDEFDSHPSASFAEVFPNTPGNGLYWSSSIITPSVSSIYNIATRAEGGSYREGVDRDGRRVILARLVRN